MRPRERNEVLGSSVVVKGDPAKPGLYTLLVRVAPNVRIEAHAHRDDRVATVVSGTWYFGYGEAFDGQALRSFCTSRASGRRPRRT